MIFRASGDESAKARKRGSLKAFTSELPHFQTSALITQ